MAAAAAVDSAAVAVVAGVATVAAAASVMRSLVSGAEEIATRRSLLLETRGGVRGRGVGCAGGSRSSAPRGDPRPAANGPGTITQARSRVRVYLTAELARARFQPAAADEVDRAARAAYARAREVWLASAKADDDADDLDDDSTPAGPRANPGRGHLRREGAP